MLEWPVLHALGKLEGEYGDPVASDSDWERARAIVRGVTDHIPRPGLRASFLARPDVRELFAGSAAVADR